MTVKSASEVLSILDQREAYENNIQIKLAQIDRFIDGVDRTASRAGLTKSAYMSMWTTIAGNIEKRAVSELEALQAKQKEILGRPTALGTAKQMASDFIDPENLAVGPKIVGKALDTGAQAVGKGVVAGGKAVERGAQTYGDAYGRGVSGIERVLGETLGNRPSAELVGNSARLADLTAKERTRQGYESAYDKATSGANIAPDALANKSMDIGRAPGGLSDAAPKSTSQAPIKTSVPAGPSAISKPEIPGTAEVTGPNIGEDISKSPSRTHVGPLVDAAAGPKGPMGGVDWGQGRTWGKAGVGALVGALLAAAGTAVGSGDEKGRKHYLRNMLLAAIAGGAATPYLRNVLPGGMGKLMGGTPTAAA